MDEMIWTGNLSENWRYFIQGMKNYIVAIGYKGKPHDVRTFLLLHYVGEKGLEVYNTFKFEDDADKLNWDVVTAEFEGYCNPRIWRFKRLPH